MENNLTAGVNQFKICNACAANHFTFLLEVKNKSISHLYKKASLEKSYNFSLVSCDQCGLVQIQNPISPEVLYKESPQYLTGFQNPAHLEDLISTVIAFQDPESVIDIGCNDGSLINHLLTSYPRVVGIEPNEYAVRRAQEKGLDVYKGILSTEITGIVLKEKGKFKTIYARHVLEHVEDIGEFLELVKRLMDKDGLFVCELPDIRNCLLQGNPSFIWEEHVNYFVPDYTRAMFDKAGFECIEEKNYVFGGGSYVQILRQKNIQKEKKGAKELSMSNIFDDFLYQFLTYKQKLQSLLKEARAKNYKIAIYGAAPRSTCLLNMCESEKFIDIAIDDRHSLKGSFLPGTEVEIKSLEDIQEIGTNKILFLLGVGAEKEHIVLEKIKKEYKNNFLKVSLFPQKDTVESLETALIAIKCLK